MLICFKRECARLGFQVKMKIAVVETTCGSCSATNGGIVRKFKNPLIFGLA